MIKLDKKERRQTRKSETYENIIVEIVNIQVIKDNNCLLFRNNTKYTWARFMQANKITKSSIVIFFTNLNLAFIWKHPRYKNIDKIKDLLTKLLYGRVIW